MNTCFALFVLCFAYCSAGNIPLQNPVLFKGHHAPLMKAPIEVVEPGYGYGAPLVDEVVVPGYGYGAGAPLVEGLLPGYAYGAPMVDAGYGGPVVDAGYGGYGHPVVDAGYGGYGRPVVDAGYGGYGRPVVDAGYGGYGAPVVDAGYGAPVVSDYGYGAPAIAAPVVEEIIQPAPFHKHKHVKEEAYDHEHDSAYRFTASDNANEYASYYPGASALAGVAYYPGHYPKAAYAPVPKLVGGYSRY